MANLYDAFLKADKALDLKSSDFVRAKKVLTPEMCEFAVRDGVTLNSLDEEDDYNSVTYAASVGASRTRTKVPDLVQDLGTLAQKLDSKGFKSLLKRLQDAKSIEVDDLKEEISRYTKLVQGACADTFWYQNFLENPYAKKGLTEEKLEVCRSMCRLLKIKYVEC
jgi:hypothetical protein